jgi:hypothetical protein
MQLKWAFPTQRSFNFSKREFDKDTIEQIAANLRRPAGRVHDPNPGAAAGAAVLTPLFVLGGPNPNKDRFLPPNLFGVTTPLPVMLLLEIFNGIWS